MNLIEALKSGKRSRRTSHGGEYYEAKDYQVQGMFSLEPEQFYADDYELEEEKRELTWEEICREFRNAKAPLSMMDRTKILNQMKENLGFGE